MNTDYYYGFLLVFFICIYFWVNHAIKKELYGNHNSNKQQS